MKKSFLKRMSMKAYLKGVFVNVLAAVPLFSMAQSFGRQESVVSSSPVAASLSRYIDFPVSLSNGIPEISVPLYEFKSPKITIPINLSYHAAGIKVTDRTSTMGLGWTLNVAGSIMRVVNGGPDDATYGFLNMVNPVWGRTNENYKINCLANYVYNTYVPGSSRDAEPDMFYFNAPGIGGKFMFRNQTVAGMKPVAAVMPYSPIKVDYTSAGIAGTKPIFVLTGTDGTVYEFGEDRRTNTMSGYNSATDYYTDNSNAWDSYTTSAWQLTKIISADGSDEVVFNYEDKQDFYEYYRLATSMYAEFGLVNTTDKEYGQVSKSNISRYEYSARLKDIVSKNGKIVFNYGDTQGFPALSTIDIYSLSNGAYTKIRSIKLSTSTFTYTQTRENTLRLDSVVDIGYKGSTALYGAPYKFSYSTSDVPPYNVNSQDLWGYYNAYPAEDLLLVKRGAGNFIEKAPEKRMPNPDVMGKAMLTKITYPTGGFSAFTFEPNQTKAMVPVLIPGQPIASKNISTTYMYVGSGSTGIDVTFSPSVNGNGTAQFIFSGSRSCSTPGSNNCVTSYPQVMLTDLTTNQTKFTYTLAALQSGQQSSESYTVTLTQMDPTHSYRLYFPIPGTVYNSSSVLQYRLNATYMDMESDRYEDQLQTVYMGGMRIKQIKSDDGRGKPFIKTYDYTKSYFNSNVFNGTFDMMHNFMSQSKYLPTTEKTVYYLESPTFPVGGASNCGISYEEVEEKIQSFDGKSLGKTVYTFNKALDYVYPRLPVMRMDMDFVRKQLVSQKVYKSIDESSYQIVKEVQNTYKNDNLYGSDSPGKDSILFYVFSSSYDFRRRVANGGSVTSETLGGVKSMGCPIYDANTEYRIDLAYHHVVRTNFTSTKTIDYTTDPANPLTTEVNFSYENPLHAQLTKVASTNSKNETVIQSYKYPLDYEVSSCLSSACKNTFNQQLTQLETTRLQCEQVAITAKNFDGYTKCGTDFDAAIKTRMTEYNACLTQAQQVYINCKKTLSENDRAILEMQDQNIVTPQLESSTTIDGRIAEKGRMLYKVVEGVKNIVKPAQLKKQAGNNPEQSYQTYTSYDSDGNLKEMSEVAGGVKVVYLWGYNGRFPVAKITGSTYDVVVSYINPTILKDPASDQQLRDELNKIRVNLAGEAMVNTFTYAPLIGITSETDGAGVTKYYEYDGLGRLKMIKDKDGKILQLFDYQYSQSITK